MVSVQQGKTIDEGFLGQSHSHVVLTSGAKLGSAAYPFGVYVEAMLEHRSSVKVLSTQRKWRMNWDYACMNS